MNLNSTEEETEHNTVEDITQSHYSQMENSTNQDYFNPYFDEQKALRDSN